MSSAGTGGRELFDHVARAAIDLLGACAAHVWIADPEGQVLRPAGTASVSPQIAALAADVADIPFGRGLAGVVYDAGEPLYVRDVQGDPRWLNPRLAVEGGIHGFAGVPLIADAARVGVLSVLFATAREFDVEERQFMGLLGGQAALAIRNAQRLAEEQRRRAYLAAILEINQKIGALEPTEALLTAIAEEAARLLDVDNAGFRLVDGEELVVAGLAGTATETMLRPRIRIGEGLSGRVLAAGRPLVMAIPEAVDLLGEHLAADLRLGYTTFLGVPLRVGNRATGVLTFRARRPFTRHEVEMAEAFAGQAAVALEHARLYREATHRLAQTRALLEVVGLLNSTLDSRRLLRRVAIRVAQVCRVDRCSLELWEGDRVLPVMSQFADGRRDPKLWEAFLRLTARPPGDIPAYARAVKTRRPVAIDDVGVEPGIPRSWVETFRIKSYLVVPLVRQDRVIGMMTLDHCERVTPFSPWQVDLATAIAGQLVLALENTRLFAAAEERLREATALLEVGQALSRREPVGERLRLVARALERAFGADMVAVYGLDPAGEALVPVAGYHVPRHLLEALVSLPIVLTRVPEVAEGWRAGRVMWSSDVQADARIDSATKASLDPASVLFAPTRLRGESVGAIVLVWWSPGRAFTDPEVRLVEGVAGQVGLALEHAELTRRTEARLHETETLLGVSRELATTLDVETLLQHFLRSVGEAIDAESTEIWLLAEDGDTLVPRATWRVPAGRGVALRRARLSLTRDALVAQAARTRRAVPVPEMATDPRVPAALRDLAPIRSQVLVPVFAQERFMGAFTASWWDEVHEAPGEELALLEAIAGQAGVAVANARLFEANRRQVEELSVLHELSRAVTGQLDQAALLEAVRIQADRVLGARHLAIVLLDDAGAGHLALSARDGVPEPGTDAPLPPGTGFPAAVLAAGGPLRTGEPAAECARRGLWPDPEEEALPYRLGVPMATADATLGVVTVARDADAFTAADERLLGGIADLAALALRSARLYDDRRRAHAQLAAAQDQLVRTEKLRALGEMASGVAHDFNNLLAAILGRTQLLLRRVDDPPVVAWLQVIERAALDGAQTVRRLQEFARVRRDQPFVEVNPVEVVREALEITRSRWRDDSLRRGVVIEVRTELAPVPPVAGDPVELREALTNLILNAVDAMPGGGTLTVTTTPGPEGVEVTVGDTGVGIPEALQRRIFDPFFTTKGTRGTGLGLSMTYGIVARHGARLSVESREGVGSLFRLSFPPATGLRAPAPGPAPVAAAVALRCLVVDDEPDVGGVIGELLEEMGHTVVVETDGVAAVARLAAERFHVVITDLAMPTLSGWEVAHAARRLAPDTVVFLLTGFGTELAPEEWKQHGIAAVLAKPLRIDDIMDAVGRAVESRTPASEEDR